MDNFAVQENYTTAIQKDSSFLDEDIHQSPRCSTPIFDRCVGSNRILYLPEEMNVNVPIPVDNRGEYNEWKKRLEHKKSLRKFKVRGPGKDDYIPGKKPEIKKREQSVENCSIISGHFELKLNLTSNRISEENIVRPAPVYQMWFPVTNYQTFWNPMNHLNNFHQQNYAPSFYGVHGIQQTQTTQYHLQPAQFFSIFSNDHQGHHHRLHHVNKNNNRNLQGEGIITSCHNHCVAKVNNAHLAQPYNASPPQMLTNRFYYQYPQVTQFMTYFGETMPSNFNYHNFQPQGFGHFPLMMNS